MTSALRVKVLDHAGELPASDINVDVEVTDPSGARWGATFYTIANVRTLLERWRSSGEHGAGAYFWGGPGQVIVAEASVGSINRAVHAIFADGDFEQVFERLDGLLADS